MSTLRVSNIEAKADASSPSVNEKVKVTNSNGDVLVHINGETSGITTVGINTTGETFNVDSNQNVTFVGDLYAPNISVAGTITYDDVTNVDSIGIITARSGVRVLDGDVTLAGAASSVGIRTDQPKVSLDASQATDAFAIPQGTTAQRPASPGSGYMRWNNTSGSLEVYNGSNWIEIVSEYFPEGSGIFG
jgi:hypothetical protein